MIVLYGSDPARSYRSDRIWMRSAQIEQIRLIIIKRLFVTITVAESCLKGQCHDILKPILNIVKKKKGISRFFYFEKNFRESRTLQSIIFVKTKNFTKPFSLFIIGQAVGFTQNNRGRKSSDTFPLKATVELLKYIVTADIAQF